MARIANPRAEGGVPVTTDDDVVRLTAPPFDYTAHQLQESRLLPRLLCLVLIYISEQQQHVRERVKDTEKVCP